MASHGAADRGTRRVRWGLMTTWLQQPDTDGDSNQHQDHTTQQLAVLTDTYPKTLAELQTDQAHGDADDCNNACRKRERHVVGPKRESDDQIVNTERCAGDDEVADPATMLAGIGLIFRSALDLRSHDAVEPGQREDRTADEVRMITKNVGQRATDEEAENRHATLKDPEHDCHLQAQLRIKTG